MSDGGIKIIPGKRVCCLCSKVIEHRTFIDFLRPKWWQLWIPTRIVHEECLDQQQVGSDK